MTDERFNELFACIIRRPTEESLHWGTTQEWDYFDDKAEWQKWWQLAIEKHVGAAPGCSLAGYAQPGHCSLCGGPCKGIC